MNAATGPRHTDGTMLEPVLVENATNHAGEWVFDTTSHDDAFPAAALTAAQYAAAVHVVDEPENADCGRGTACVHQRPTLIVGGEVRKYGPDFIGLHLADNPDTGYEHLRFKPFYVTADSLAICEGCAEVLLAILTFEHRGPGGDKALEAAHPDIVESIRSIHVGHTKQIAGLPVTRQSHDLWTVDGDYNLAAPWVAVQSLRDALHEHHESRDETP